MPRDFFLSDERPLFQHSMNEVSKGLKVKSQKNKLPERKKRVEDLVGPFKEFMQDRKEEGGRKGKTKQIRNYAQ